MRYNAVRQLMMGGNHETPAFLLPNALALTMFFSQEAGAQPTQITACGPISQSGAYELANNLAFTGNSGACPEMTADFITIDLAGFSITGPGIAGPTTAIEADSTTTGIAVTNGAERITGHRHGHRSRSLMGTFGWVEIAMPRQAQYSRGQDNRMEEHGTAGLPAANQAGRCADRRRLFCPHPTAGGCGGRWRPSLAARSARTQ